MGIEVLKSDNKKIVVLVRQRIVAKSNGSSRYLLGILEHLQKSGHELHIVWPLEATFGRWPYLILSPDVTQFPNLYWRGGIRIGRYVISKNPKVYLSALLAVIDRLLLKGGIIKAPITKRAQSSLAAPVVNDDIIFVERYVNAADCVLFDYVFSVHFAGEWLNETPSLVLMHDLFFKREKDFAQQGLSDNYGQISEADEMFLLGQCGGVIAIQEEEAKQVRVSLPDKLVGVAPIGVEVVGAPQAGDDDLISFVGSNAGPNVLGIKWFLDAVWPRLRSMRPDVRLEIAGSCCDVLQPEPGVTLLGVVADLAPLYERAGVVISPLTVGSGLKVKLIEGLAAGKAMVVTPTTLQGVPELAEYVFVEQEPELFASAIAKFLDNRTLRLAIAAEGLAHMKANFSPEAAYGWIDNYYRTAK